jgi:hypothetical protein
MDVRNLSRKRINPQLLALPLFQAAAERELRALPPQARWVARRYRLSPTLATVVAEQLFPGDAR